MWHHVMNRVVEGNGWLSGEADAVAFLASARRAATELGIEVHAFAVLPRHYHLLLRASGERSLALVAALERAVAFPGYDAPLIRPVRGGRHLLGVSRYVHLNPVEARLVERPEDWPHSSFGAYLGDPSPEGFPVTDAVLARFGTIGARHRYRAYVAAGLERGTRDLFGRAKEPADDPAWRIEPGLGARQARRRGRAASPRIM